MPPNIDTENPETDVASFMLNKYNKLEKSAFDVMDNIDLKKSFKKADSFGAGVVDMMKDAGIKSDSLKGMAGATVGSDEFMDSFREAAQSGADFAVDSALGAALDVMLPGLPGVGTAATAAWESIRAWWRNNESERELGRMGLLERGQWLYINNGRSQKEVDAVGWFGSTEEGDHKGLRRRMLIEDHLSMGFFIGLGAKNGRVQVFNFEEMHPVDLRFEDVAGCPEKDAIKYDKNKYLNDMRDLWFEDQKTEPALMDTDINTDPGAEAVYEEYLVHVVKTNRSSAIIVFADGTRKKVTLDKLQPGRKTHSNSWVYGEGYKDNGFLADGSARIFSGQWIWVSAQPDIKDIYGSEVELACVWKIGPEGLFAFRSLDGTLAVVDEFARVTDELNDFLNKDWSFGLFKDKSVTAGDTERFRMSQHPDDVLVCVGKTYDIQIKLEKVDPQKYTPVEAEVTEDVLPTYDEAIRDTADYREDLYNQNPDLQRKGGRRRGVGDEPPTEDDSKKSNIMPFVIGGVVLILAYNFIK